jgi:hypothetical protein
MGTNSLSMARRSVLDYMAVASVPRRFIISSHRQQFHFNRHSVALRAFFGSMRDRKVDRAHPPFL